MHTGFFSSYLAYLLNMRITLPAYLSIHWVFLIWEPSELKNSVTTCLYTSSYWCPSNYHHYYVQTEKGCKQIWVRWPTWIGLCPIQLPRQEWKRAVSLMQGFLVKYLTLLVIVNHLKLKGKLPPKIPSTDLILHQHYKIEDNLWDPAGIGVCFPLLSYPFQNFAKELFIWYYMIFHRRILKPPYGFNFISESILPKSTFTFTNSLCGLAFTKLVSFPFGLLNT